MFDAYLQEQSLDPVTRNRAMAAMVLATLTATAVGTLALVAEKLSVSQVAAPSVPEVLTLVLGPTPPPAPPPPKRTGTVDEAAGAAGSTTQTRDAMAGFSPPSPGPEAIPLEADEVSTPTSEASRRSEVHGFGGPPGHVPGPDRLAKGTCVVPPCGERGTRRAEAPPATPSMQPLDRVKALAKFTPDPDRSALARTQVARHARRSGSVTISFCINEAGKVFDVTTQRAFGDREVDTIARDAVRRWRFRPMVVAGRAQRTCSQVTFAIQFE